MSILVAIPVGSQVKYTLQTFLKGCAYLLELPMISVLAERPPITC